MGTLCTFDGGSAIVDVLDCVDDTCNSFLFKIIFGGAIGTVASGFVMISFEMTSLHFGLIISALLEPSSLLVLLSGFGWLSGLDDTFLLFDVLDSPKYS